MENRVLRGVIHGKTIELHDAAEISDGSEVDLVIRNVRQSPRRAGDGFLRTEGALVDDPEWDEIMEEVQRARKVERNMNWN